MDKHDKLAPPSEATPKKRAWLSTRLIVMISIAIAAVLLVAVQWNWTHGKDQRIGKVSDQVASLNKDVEKSKSDNRALKDELDAAKSRNKSLTKDKESLEAKIVELNKPVIVTTRTPAEPTLKVLDSKHWNSVLGSWERDNDFALIRIEIKNVTDNDYYFSTSNAKLKDSSNVAYPYYTTSPVGDQPRFSSGIEYLPEGYIEIENQTIAPGETVNGVLVYYVPAGLKSASLYFGDKSYPISL